MSVIEWPGPGPTSSAMSVAVLDPLGTVPTNVIDFNHPFKVNVKWVVPAPTSTLLGGSFRLRVFVESFGPGQEMAIGGTTVVPAVPVVVGDAQYSQDISIAANTLLGEGELFGGVAVSGTYKVVAVLQHLNTSGTPTEASGYAELGGVLFIRTP